MTQNGKLLKDIMDNVFAEGGQMIRRADGSYSRRGLWDNIRANRGSGKKPTKEMLEQERKIRAEEKKYGGTNNPGFEALPEYVQAKILANMGYGGITVPMMKEGGEPQNEGFQALPEYVQAKILSNMGYGGYIPEMGYGGAALTDAIDRLQKREDRLVAKGYKAVDEGRENKADRILARAARVEDRKIRLMDSMAYGGYIPEMAYGGVSVVDYLNSVGRDSDKASRAALAREMNIEGYDYSAEKNMELLQKLKDAEKAPVTKKPQPKADTRPLNELINRSGPVSNNNKNMYPFEQFPAMPKPTRTSNSKPAQKQAEKQTDVSSLYMRRENAGDEKLPANLKNAKKNLESGFVVDKRSNTGYIVKNGKIQKSFPVITGSNPDGTENPYTVAQLAQNPSLRATPAGTYMMAPDKDIYGAPGFRMRGIPAFGEQAPNSRAVAVHTTYDPASRDKFYNMSPADRYKSYGCINCRPQDIGQLTQNYFPQGDTLMVVDPAKNKKDKAFLQTLGKKKSGGEVNGEMALGQMASVSDKMSKLLEFVRPSDNLDPWIASKLAVMDHSADAISDYLMYGPESQMEEDMPEMGKGGYVVTRSNDRKGKTHKVTGPDGTVKYFGDSKLGQHPKDPERKAAFYARHKKNLEGNPHFRAFARATWEDGGAIGPDSGFYNVIPQPLVGASYFKKGGSTFSGNAWYAPGGPITEPTAEEAPAEYFNQEPLKPKTWSEQLQASGIGPSFGMTPLDKRVQKTYDSNPMAAFNYDKSLVGMSGRKYDRWFNKKYNVPGKSADEIADGMMDQTFGNPWSLYNIANYAGNIVDGVNNRRQMRDTLSRERYDTSTLGLNAAQDPGQGTRGFRAVSGTQQNFDMPDQLGGIFSMQGMNQKYYNPFRAEEGLQIDGAYAPGETFSEFVPTYAPTSENVVSKDIRENYATPAKTKASDLPEADADVKEFIAQKESGGDYKALPKRKDGSLVSSAAGKYQFLWNAHKGAIGSITGVRSKEEFLNNPEAQERYMDYWDNTTLTPTAQKLIAKGVTAPLPAIKYMIHFAGPKGAEDYFLKGKETVDGFGMSTSRQMRRMGVSEQGGEVEMTADEIMNFMAMGGEIEYLD